MQTVSGVGIGLNRPKRTFTRTKKQSPLAFKCLRLASTPDPEFCTQAAACLDAATATVPFICLPAAPSSQRTRAAPAAGRSALSMHLLQAIVDEIHARQSEDTSETEWPLPTTEDVPAAYVAAPAPRTPLATMLDDYLLGEHAARVDTHAHATEWPLDWNTHPCVPFRFDLVVRPAGVFSEAVTPVLQTTVAFLPAWRGPPVDRSLERPTSFYPPMFHYGGCPWGHGHFDSAGAAVKPVRMAPGTGQPMACSRWVRRAGADGRGEWVCVVEVRIPSHVLHVWRVRAATFRLDARVQLGTEECDVVWVCRRRLW